MDRVAIGVDRGAANGAVFILHVMWFLGWLSSPMHCFLKSLVRVLHFQRDIPHAIAMLADMIRRQIVGRHRRGQNEVQIGAPRCTASSKASSASSTSNAISRTPSPCLRI